MYEHKYTWSILRKVNNCYCFIMAGRELCFKSSAQSISFNLIDYFLTALNNRRVNGPLRIHCIRCDAFEGRCTMLFDFE